MARSSVHVVVSTRDLAANVQPSHGFHARAVLRARGRHARGDQRSARAVRCEMPLRGRWMQCWIFCSARGRAGCACGLLRANVIGEWAEASPGFSSILDIPRCACSLHPRPFFVDATKSTFARNGFPAISNISQAAVVTWQQWQQARQQWQQALPNARYADSHSMTGAAKKDSRPPHPTTHFVGTYTPCGVGERDQKAHSSGSRHGWDAPLRPIRQVLHERKYASSRLDCCTHLHDLLTLLRCPRLPCSLSSPPPHRLLTASIHSASLS